MAQRGRPRKTDSRPAAATDTRTEYYCSRCGRQYKQQRGNFPYSQSSLYAGNNHYATICTTCIKELYDHYVETLGSEPAAMRRICCKLDMYFGMDAYAMTDKSSPEQSRVGAYIQKLALRQFQDKTFDTTLDKEHDVATVDNESTVTDATIRFFGEGFEASDYIFLQEQYDEWVSQYECKNKAQEELFKDLSFAQLNLVKAQRENNMKKVKEAQEAKHKAMQNQGITPIQKKDNTFAEKQTFGTLLQKYEETRPLPDPDPEWADADGIIYFITVYFVGHICKMFGLKNKYSAMYEREMDKYRIQMQLDEEDDESAFESYFESYLEKREASGIDEDAEGGDEDAYE